MNGKRQPVGRWKRVRKRRQGSALVELALISPLLLLLLAGVLNYGFALRTATAVATAAQAGARYGSTGPAQANDAAGIRAAALNSAPNISGITVNSTVSCQCPGGGAVSCSGSCGSGKMLMYVQVAASANAATFFSYTGLPFAGTVQAKATMRAQ
jgi:Flp pilus assembly protein TadG